MRTIALSLLSLMLALPVWASQVPHETPLLEGPVLLTGEYVREHREYFDRMDVFAGDSRFSLHRDLTEWRYLTFIVFRDNTCHAILSRETPPQYNGERMGDILVRGEALVYSVSPSDQGHGYADEDWVEVLDKDAEMDFQTALRVTVGPERTLTITHDLANTATLPVAEMRSFELTKEAQSEFYRLGSPWQPRLKAPPYPRFIRRASRVHWDPAFAWDLTAGIGFTAATDANSVFLTMVPGFSFLRNGDGTGYNLTGLSVWLLSAKDNRFRLLKFGVGLGMRDRVVGSDEYGFPQKGKQPALTLQFAPVGIAFGTKEHWGRDKAYTKLDRLRRRVYLDVGLNAFTGGGGRMSWGPYIQTSFCLRGCNP